MNNDTYIAGAHLAKTAGTTLSLHAKEHLGVPAFYRYCRFTRTKRFWDGEPQFEEISAEQKAQIRVLFGHGVFFETALLMPDRTPEFLITIRNPVPFFLSRFSHERVGAQKRLFDLTYEKFMAKESGNHFSRFVLTYFRPLAEYGDEMSARNVISVLKCFKFVTATENIDRQASIIWEQLGIPTEMMRRNVAKRKEAIEIDEEEIRNSNEIDIALHAEIVRGGADTGGAVNPFGYDPDALRQRMAEAALHRPSDDQALSAAYSELANQLFLEFTLQAAIARSEEPLHHVKDPHLLRTALRDFYEQKATKYSPEQHQRSEQKLADFRRSAGP